LMVPTWSAVRSDLDNDYTRALDEALGTTLRYQMTTGNDYRDKQAAVFASPDNVADWVSVFGWNPPPQFDLAAEALFEDLTPWLAGDEVARWPNLANLPTAAWQFGIFRGALYGIPVQGETVTDALYARTDLLAELGIEPPRTAEELLEVAREVTDPAGGRWATNDLAVAAPNLLFGAPPDWRVRDGALEYRWETDEYREALEFQRQLFADGLAHPDAVAGAGDAKQRFTSGAVVLHYDGVGAWGEMAATMSEAGGTLHPLSALSAGGREPMRYRGSAANFFSFLRKSEPAKVEEMLDVANFLAAPFGSAEWELINFGAEGVHFERNAEGIPVPTDALAEQHPGVLSTLVTGPLAKYDFSNPDFVPEYCAWAAAEAALAVEGPFFGYQVIRPPEFTALDQPLYDLEADIIRGRRPLADLDAEVDVWRRAGGDRMREYFGSVLEQIA
ncbi:extracellular solute-binding protein, partial [Actinosynnema sp.]|uniref:extracellular solute-binding protein n=1 Tax=Actinosynnema sp. TaxID=1872144 RepID=UPI003F82528D